MFGNQKVARFRPHFRNDFRPVRRRGLRRPRSINDWPQNVFTFRRECDSHQKYRHPMFSECVGNRRRIFHDNIC